jgi:hypothetical protein
MVARSTKGQRSFEPQGLCPTATYLAQSIRGHHTFQRGRLGQMPGKQTLNARVAETTLTFSPRGGPRKGWGAEGEGMVRFIVALLALLASTAAMAEPQRPDLQGCERSHPRSLVDRRAWQHHVLLDGSQHRAVGHRHQRQHHPLRQLRSSARDHPREQVMVWRLLALVPVWVFGNPLL